MMRLTLIALAFFVLQCTKKEQAVDVTPFIGKWVLASVEPMGLETQDVLQHFACANASLQQNDLRNSFYYRLDANKQGAYYNTTVLNQQVLQGFTWLYDKVDGEKIICKINNSITSYTFYVKNQKLRAIQDTREFEGCVDANGKAQTVYSNSNILLNLKKI